MHNYVGCECPVCKNELREEDDIVVCPECGAPYHRDCYTAHGTCVYQPMHGGGFEWRRPADAKAKLTCPSCGSVCEEETIFCNQCGQPLHGAATPPATATPTPFGLPGIPLSGEAAAQYVGSFDGISAKDWATYIGTSAPYYLYQFRRQDESGNKLGFILSAALFAPYYLFYRKVWLAGIFAGLLNILLNLPSAFVIFVSAGIKLPFVVNAVTLNRVASLCSMALLVVNALWGFFGVALYRYHSAKIIKKWRAVAASEAEFQEKLHRKSGPCKIVLYVICGVFAFSMLLPMFGLAIL